MIMDIVEIAKKCGAIEHLNNEYPTYLNHHIKFNVKILEEFSKKLMEDKDVEIQTLRAKVASAEMLVEALREITYSHDGYARKKAEQALATYDKLSETNTEVLA